MITPSFLDRWCHTCATLTTVTESATERDEMNRPTRIETTETVRICFYPEQGTETTTGRQIATGRHVVFLKPCTAPAATSTLTIGSAVYEFDGPALEHVHPKTAARIGWEARIVRSS